MPQGWDLKSGNLTKNNVAISEYWAYFNHFYSSASRNTSSYKFGLIKAIMDSLLSMEPTERGMELSYEDLFSKFTENYWNLVAKYHIRQMRNNGRSLLSSLELHIERLAQNSPGAAELNYENLSTEEKNILVTLVKNDCKRYVIGAVYQDFNGCLYGFDKYGHGIWLHNGAYQFLMAYKIEVEQLNYYAWAKFLEHISLNAPVTQLISKLESSTPRRSNLSVYREILRNEFEVNNCFYCGCKLGKTSHVDHALPWSFVKSDHLWNFVLACPKCNTKKRDMLPNRQKLAGIINRNCDMAESNNPFIISEFKGYSQDLMWNVWEYAREQGYVEYGTEKAWV